MKKFFKKTICILLISFYFLKGEQVQSLVPYYYFPTIKNLQKESSSIGNNAYQLLYFGQYEQSLNLAKLAVEINKNDEKLWLILAEAQIANKLYKKALTSLDNAQKINPNIVEIYFAKSNLYTKISQLKNAKSALEKALKISFLVIGIIKSNPKQSVAKPGIIKRIAANVSAAPDTIS